ncbi:MAG: serine hydrolase [Acidimicrobiia bacterium]|nr:serine hydrolase [Acidimicrobiia bacterium]
MLAVLAMGGVTGMGQAPQRSASARSAGYVPTRDNWETRKPADVGMDAALLNQAIEYAKTRDSAWGRDDYMADQVKTFGRPLGQVPKSHGRTNGIVIRHGYVVAEFGDTGVVEPTYSVAKSYLSTLLGLAIDRGMIRRVSDRVVEYVHDGGYVSPHNAAITWEHHARQASEWDGTLFDKTSTFIGHEEFGAGEMKPRELRAPGTYYEYNDVRVNRFGLSLLRVWRRPLPDVLKTEIMDPVGASDTWRWIGYDNSDVTVDGKTMRSVPGGTRWGGGLWMSTRDHARFGLLMARMGNWNGKQLVSADWIRQATIRGGPANSNDYGYMWWLNTTGGSKGVPTTSYEARGGGSNTIFIDPDDDVVIVWRWHAGGDFFARVVASIVRR